MDSAIDMSLDELVQFINPNMAYDACDEYFVKDITKTDESSNNRTDKQKTKMRQLTMERQKGARFTEDAIAPEEHEAPEKPKKRWRKRNRHFNNNNQCANRNRNANQLKRWKPPPVLTVEIKNNTEPKPKRQIRTVMSVQITTLV